VNWTIGVEHNPTEEVRAAILGRLADFNSSHGYPADLGVVAVVLRDPSGEIIGGLWGKTVYDWLFVEYLIVPDELRGFKIGAKLMRCAEDLARERGCVGAWLTTFPFQARGFYEKLGYAVFAELENSPDDNARLFMRKTLQS
jgi:GNAT superfamily N-acetyltransferase